VWKDVAVTIRICLLSLAVGLIGTLIGLALVALLFRWVRWRLTGQGW
jgi:hypothetical protein